MVPPVPHAMLLVGVTHFLAALQQPAHAAPPQVHATLEHDSLAAHVPHAPPPAPHGLLLRVAKGTHVPAALQPQLQQPVGQLAG